MRPLDRTCLKPFRPGFDAETTGPTDADRSATPSLDLWRRMLSATDHPITSGRVPRHPRRGDARIATSSVVTSDARAAWPRTFSRFHRFATVLGRVETDPARDPGRSDGSVGKIGLDGPGPVPTGDPERPAHVPVARIDKIRRAANEPRRE